MNEGTFGLDRPEDPLYAELSRVNSELVNVQRELAQRNAALEQLAATLDLRVAERTEQLQQSNSELETLAYAMAHDLRAPARHVDAFASLLENSGAAGLQPREREWLAMMRAAAQRQCALIDDILGYLRLGSAEMSRERIDMHAEVARIIAEVRDEHPGARIEWKVGNLPPAFADRALVHTILRNLIDNAVKFTSRQSAAAIEIGVQSHGGELAFFVSDDGAGFDPQRAARMFKPFERLHSPADYPGLGIGLAIVKRLVTRHDGRLWAESAPRKGATFHFTLGHGRHA